MRLNRFAPWLLLLGCLLFAANCGKDEAVPTSGAVGHVVVVKGEVSAQRGTEAARSVHIKDTVFADDTVVTGDEASIQILLDHNGALWELGANKEQRIDKGIAYRAKKKGAGALTQEQEIATSAAGRGTTREAADSVGTVLLDTEEEEADESDGEPTTEVVGGAEGGLRETMPAAADGVADVAAKTPDPIAAPNIRKPTSPSRRRTRAKRNPSRRSTPAPPMPASAAPPRAQPKPKPRPAAFPSPGAGVAAAEPAAESAPQKEEASEKQQSATGEQISFVKRAGQSCHKAHGGKGTVRYEIKADGLFTASAGHASLKPLVTCLKAAVQRKGLPNSAAVKSSLRFE